MGCGCGCGSNRGGSKKEVYVCESCGKKMTVDTSKGEKPKDCCGKPMKKL